MAQPDHTSRQPGIPGESEAVRVHPLIARLGAYSWRLIAIAIVGWGLLWLLSALWVLLLAAAVAVLLARALDAPVQRLRRTRLPGAAIAAMAIIGFLLFIAGSLALLVPPVVAEFQDLGPTVEDAIDSLENWLVDDSPFDVSRADVQDFRDEAKTAAGDLARSQSGAVVSGTLLAFEVVTGLVLALITTFFILKDGERFSYWVQGWFPENRRDVTTRMAARAWRTLGGYLRGSAMLGVVEAVIIGLTVEFAGGALAIPIAVITFFAAFLPFIGAVLAGVVAVLVTMVTAGVPQAAVVAIVAVLVQQFDSDLLAPFVFGKNLELHPLVVLVSITAGGTLFGVFGAFVAVPISAVVINVIAEARGGPVDGAVDPDAGLPVGGDGVEAGADG